MTGMASYINRMSGHVTGSTRGRWAGFVLKLQRVYNHTTRASAVARLVAGLSVCLSAC